MATDHLTKSQALTLIDREILSWPGVSKGPGRFGSIAYTFGRWEIGHVHGNEVTDFGFPRAIRDELLDAGRAVPHHAGVRGAVSHPIRDARDVAPVVALFRLNYERLRVEGPRVNEGG